MDRIIRAIPQNGAEIKMKCPNCGHNKSPNPAIKPSPDKYNLPADSSYRRRTCNECGENFGTVEIHISEFEYLHRRGGEEALKKIREFIEAHKEIDEIA